MNNYSEVWKAVLSLIKDQVTPVCYETWFLNPLKVKKIDNRLNMIYMDVNTTMDPDFFADIINSRYLNLLQDAFKEVLGEEYRVIVKGELSVDNSVDNGDNSEVKPAKKTRKKSRKTLLAEKFLNPKYTFDNFVVGPSNSFAHAAALAVAESPGIASNPLFIYGGSGLGKTHLIQAIGIRILENDPETNVLYTSSENFLNDYVTAIQEKRMNEFKSKYRKVDVLIIDDVQFLEDKERIQEEFFYTFNALFQNNKQIIITADKDPNKLQGLDERLITRFQWNLMADIQPADYETRVAILQKNAQILGMEIDDDLREVINIIAEKIKDNIRELEGAFTRVKFFSETLGEKPNKAFAKKVLKDILSNSETMITPEKIKKIVCKYYNIKVADIESSKRTNNIAFPRQVAMYLIREMTDSSFPKIGDMFGGRDHTTVKYACGKIEDEINQDKNFAEIINSLKKEIRD
ncbi:MAG: chromosomal replication initiator protein DnaA [Firmicutes bacterium]|nr:chromosomal replication initiator protein DnaA [Bacillota bacterium]